MPIGCRDSENCPSDPAAGATVDCGCPPCADPLGIRSVLRALAEACFFTTTSTTLSSRRSHTSSTIHAHPFCPAPGDSTWPELPLCKRITHQLHRRRGSLLLSRRRAPPVVLLQIVRALSRAADGDVVLLVPFARRSRSRPADRGGRGPADHSGSVAPSPTVALAAWLRSYSRIPPRRFRSASPWCGCGCGGLLHQVLADPGLPAPRPAAHRAARGHGRRCSQPVRSGCAGSPLPRRRGLPRRVRLFGPGRKIDRKVHAPHPRALHDRVVRAFASRSTNAASTGTSHAPPLAAWLLVRTQEVLFLGAPYSPRGQIVSRARSLPGRCLVPDVRGRAVRLAAFGVDEIVLNFSARPEGTLFLPITLALTPAGDGTTPGLSHGTEPTSRGRHRALGNAASSSGSVRRLARRPTRRVVREDLMRTTSTQCRVAGPVHASWTRRHPPYVMEDCMAPENRVSTSIPGIRRGVQRGARSDIPRAQGRDIWPKWLRPMSEILAGPTIVQEFDRG